MLTRESERDLLSVVITKCQTRRAALFCDLSKRKGGRVVFILCYHGSGFKDVLGTGGGQKGEGVKGRAWKKFAEMPVMYVMERRCL